jgi:hypothetical protein
MDDKNDARDRLRHKLECLLNRSLSGVKPRIRGALGIAHLEDSWQEKSDFGSQCDTRWERVAGASAQGLSPRMREELGLQRPEDS